MLYLIKINDRTSRQYGEYFLAEASGTTSLRRQAYLYTADEVARHTAFAKDCHVLIPVSEEEGDGGLQLNT